MCPGPLTEVIVTTFWFFKADLFGWLSRAADQPELRTEPVLWAESLSVRRERRGEPPSLSVSVGQWECEARPTCDILSWQQRQTVTSPQSSVVSRNIYNSISDHHVQITTGQHAPRWVPPGVPGYKISTGIHRILIKTNKHSNLMEQLNGQSTS